MMNKNTVELKILRPTVVNGKDTFSDATVTTDAKTARELVALGKAIELGSEDVKIQAAKPKTAKKEK